MLASLLLFPLCWLHFVILRPVVSFPRSVMLYLTGNLCLHNRLPHTDSREGLISQFNLSMWLANWIHYLD